MKTYSTNEIYSDLYEQLINAVIPAGSKIKPVELQSKYGCSTNTIRDTLLRLSKIGLVTFQMQRGFAPAKHHLKNAQTSRNFVFCWNKKVPHFPFARRG